MDTSDDLTAMERAAYRSTYSDGIVDVFVGLSFLVIGSIWIWAEDYGGLAGIIPAVAAPSLIPLRKRVVEARGGYVRWGAPRRRWEKRNLWGAFLAGVATFLLAIVAFFLFEGSTGGRDLVSEIAPGLLAFILAVLAIILAMMLESGRFVAYAAVLVAGGVFAVGRELNPGWPILAAGLAVTFTGAVMLIRFLRGNPAIDTE
jgi:hypothetical protein